VNTFVPHYTRPVTTHAPSTNFTLTDKQVAFLGQLCTERGITSATIGSAFRKPRNNKEFSAIIEWVKAQPRTVVAAPTQPSAPQSDPYAGVAPVEEGKKAKAWHYALRDEVDGTVRFYRVKRGRKPGFWFIDVQASDDYHSVRNPGRKEAILKAIAADPKGALALYGQEVGSCGRCGRTLTSEYRKLGIGPVCIDK